MKSPKSIRAKLLNISKESGIDFQSVIIRYFHERILYRISTSEYVDHFVLKGGNLMYAIYGLDSRPTTDIDLEGLNIHNIPSVLETIFLQILLIPIDDGITFNLTKLKVDPIQENNNYQGLRITLETQLDTIKQMIQVDVGFGDAITPQPIKMNYPTILEDFLAPNLWTYTIETVIAEKLQAMLVLAQLNSRMKDFYDIHMLIQSQKIDYNILKEAVKRTFSQRNTPLEFDSNIFQETFYTDQNRLKMWNNFLKKINVDKIEFKVVMKNIEELILLLKKENISSKFNSQM
jgi:predicted nucleotidyltransferase component of viral defense system